MTDILEIAKNRLERQIKLKKDKASFESLFGYHEAICDILWDYNKLCLVSEEWDKYLKEQADKGKIKFSMIDIDKIKMEGG